MTQAWPSWQSASLVHTVMHAPPEHLKGAHASTPGARHTPLPSHVPAVSSRSPAQAGDTQIVSAPYRAQPPKPSHVPVWPHETAPSFLQMPRGSATPGSIGQHVPRRPT
jgi:hypothetical protein